MILAQLAERERPPEQIMKGRHLPILDFSLAMEDCITSLYKMEMCMSILAKSQPLIAPFVDLLIVEKNKVRDFRNQQEHMHQQIASGQTGSGPIMITLSNNGESMQFRNLKMPLTFVHALIEEIYSTLVKLFPKFDSKSIPLKPGILTLSITGSMTIETCLRPEGERS